MIYSLSNLNKLEKYLHKYLCIYSTLLLLLLAFFVYTQSFVKEQYIEIESAKNTLNQTKENNFFLFEKIKKMHHYANISSNPSGVNQKSFKASMEILASESNQLKLSHIKEEAFSGLNQGSDNCKTNNISIKLSSENIDAIENYLNSLQNKFRESIHLKNAKINFMKNSYILNATFTSVKCLKEAT